MESIRARSLQLLDDGRIRLGGRVSLADVAAAPVLQRPAYRALSRAASCAAQGGVPARDTIGSDVCQMVYPSEVGPALVALAARARIVGPGGERVVRFEEFFLPPTREIRHETVLKPGEVLADILLPALHANSRSTYRRVSETGVDYAVASVAVSVIAAAGLAENTRIVLGAAAPAPWRAREAEKVLDGFQIDRMLIAEAVDAAMADAAPMADNKYKIGLLRALLVDALEEIWELRPSS